MDMSKNVFFVILGAVLLTALLLVPGLVLDKCPLGLTEDSLPGNCPLYTDQNQDQLCDIAQADLGAKFPNLWKLSSQRNLASQFFQPEVLVVLGLLILGTSLVFIKKYLWLRYLSLLIGLVYLGFMKASLICPLLTLQFLFLIKSRVVINLSIFLIFLLPIIFALLFGRIFCWWVCPFGAFQEFLHRFIYRGKIKTRSCPILIFKKAVYLKYLILLAIILAVIFFRKPILCGLEPFGALFGHFVTPISVTALILLVIASIFIFRPWCKYFCPYGAILSLLSKIRIFRTKS
jgi:polyferredoxin